MGGEKSPSVVGFFLGERPHTPRRAYTCVHVCVRMCACVYARINREKAQIFEPSIAI